MGWAPPRGVKDNKEEKDALAWKGVAIATLSVEQEIGLGYRQSDQQIIVDTIACNHQSWTSSTRPSTELFWKSFCSQGLLPHDSRE